VSLYATYGYHSANASASIAQHYAHCISQAGGVMDHVIIMHQTLSLYETGSLFALGVI
jgi:hypothetical protein